MSLLSPVHHPLQIFQSQNVVRLCHQIRSRRSKNMLRRQLKALCKRKAFFHEMHPVFRQGFPMPDHIFRKCLQSFQISAFTSERDMRNAQALQNIYSALRKEFRPVTGIQKRQLHHKIYAFFRRDPASGPLVHDGSFTSLGEIPAHDCDDAVCF